MSPATWGAVLVGVALLACAKARRRAGVGLAVYLQGVVCAAAAQLAVLTEGVPQARSLSVSLLLAAWMLGSRLGRGPLVARAKTDGASPASGHGRPDGRGGWIVDFAHCGRCGSVSVASGRLETDPAEVVTRSACCGCGAELVGVASPTAPGQLVWFEPAEVTEEIA